MKPFTLLFLLVAFLANSVLYAQDPVTERESNSNFEKKSLTLSDAQKEKIKFAALLKAAKDDEGFSTAITQLKAAQSLCSDDKIEGCTQSLNETTQAIFNQWMQTFQTESNAQDARTGLLQLSQQFCDGSFKGMVNCSDLSKSLEGINEVDHRADYDNYLQQAQNARTLDAQLTALRKAEAICETYLKDNCQADIKNRIKDVYVRNFQEKVRHLRSANLDYEDQKDRLDELKDLMTNGALTSTYTQQYDRLFLEIHEKEIRRLINQSGNYEQQLRNIRDAERINEKELNGQLNTVIENAKITLVDEELADLLNDRRGNRDFNRQLDRVEAAQDLLDDLPDYARNQRLNQLREFRKDVVENELYQRRQALNNTRDWRATLDGYESLLQFAQRYSSDLDRNTRRQLLADRERFTIGEYEARIQQSVALLQRQDLAGAQLALAGAVQLANTNVLPEGPAKYRHRELYQKLYDEHYRQLQLAKVNRNWTQAEQSIGLIDNLYAEAPFILARASIRDELILLDVAKFEAQLADAPQVFRTRGQSEQFTYFTSLMDGFQQLQSHLNTSHRDQLGRLAVDLSKQPLDAARAAIQKNDYGRALAAIQPLNAFLYERNYRSILPDRPYSDMNQLIEASTDRQVAIFKNAVANLQNADQEQKTITALSAFTSTLNDLQGWNEAKVQQNIKDLYQQLLLRKKANMIARMQAGDLNYLGELAQIKGLQREQGKYISSQLVESIAQELDFYGAYEGAKDALRRTDYNRSMEGFRTAKDKLEQLASTERFDKTDLIENGLRKSLEGMLTTLIKRNQNIGASAKKETYRQILGLRLAHADVPLTDGAEYALKEAELSWFGGGCRQDYRAYTIHILEAEQAIAEKDYAVAIPALESAQMLKTRIERCMLPMDDVADQLNYYQLAVDFNERKADLDQLYSKGQWEPFAEAYHELWMAYQDYSIREKFGYSMEPFGKYVLAKNEPRLMEYYVLNYCTEDKDIDEVAKTVQELSYRISKDRMQQLGHDVAQRMYPAFPSKKYQTSFAYLTAKGKADKKGFKAFKKGYKKAWKRLR